MPPEKGFNSALLYIHFRLPSLVVQYLFNCRMGVKYNMSDTKAKIIATGTIEQTTDVAAKGLDETKKRIIGGVEKTANGFEFSHAKMKEGFEKAKKNSEEIITFNRDNFDAVVKSSKVFATGMLSISEQLTAYTKAAVEDLMSFGRSLMYVKSVKEAVKIQADHACASIEKVVSGSNIITGESVKLGEQAFASLSARMERATEIFRKIH